MSIADIIGHRRLRTAIAIAILVGLGGCAYEAAPGYASAGVAYGPAYGGGYYAPSYQPDYTPYVLGGLGLAIGGAIIASHDHDDYDHWHDRGYWRHRDWGGDHRHGWHGHDHR